MKSWATADDDYLSYDRYRPSAFMALRRAFWERAMNPPPPREPTPEPLAATPPASGRAPIQEQPLMVQERVWCRVFDFAQMHSSYKGVRCTAERLMGVCRLWRVGWRVDDVGSRN